MQPIIEIKNISKKYNINHQKGGYITLRNILTNIFRHPFGYIYKKAKEITGIAKKEEFWALKDINFEIQKGEVIGIIGANGAGKSTLLKILSQITPPTTGEIIIRGRVGSLLEVGTGFHPELTGRENIMLNGAILGMKKSEIIKKFDAIIEFAGIEKFLDTPVKFYSSGMYVRLAFSVAAHMEPDILIVDEVLAVGDIEFQKKCLGKMEEVTCEEGRTILFVSHNIAAIERLCAKTILLKNGEIIKYGKTADVVNFYLNFNRTLNLINKYPIKNNLDGQITQVSILNKDGKAQSQIPIVENFTIEIELDIRKALKNKMIFLWFEHGGEKLLVSSEGDKDGKYKNYEPGKYRTLIEIPAFLFQAGTIFLTVGLMNYRDGRNYVDAVRDIYIEITNKNNPRQLIFGEDIYGKISTLLNYKTERI